MNELSKANQVPVLHQIIGKYCAPFRINLVGGEPLLLGKNRLASIIEKAQKKYGFITSLVTNGSLLMENLELVSRLDTLGLSVDSFSSEILRSIGRCSRSGKVLSEAEIVKTMLARTVGIPLQYHGTHVVVEHLLGHPFKDVSP